MSEVTAEILYSIDSQKPRSLPAGWRWVKLEDVVTPNNGYWGSDLKFSDSTEALVLGVGNITNDGQISLDGVQKRYLSAREREAIASEGDLLVVKSSGSASNIRSGKAGLCSAEQSGKIACSNFMIRLSVHRDKADPYLLWLVLNSGHAKKYIRYIAGSTTYPNIKWESYRNFSFPLPPLVEQKRIAAILNEHMAAVEKARAAAEAQLDAARRLPAANLRAVFNSPEAQRWPTKRLSETAKLERGRFSPRPRNDPRYFGGKYPWIQIGEVEAAQKYIVTYKNTLNENGLRVSKLFPKGTLVISIAATIGALSILSFDSCMPDSLVGITPRDGISDTEYLYYLLTYIRDHLESIAPQMAQANLKLAILEPLEIPLPSLEQQKQVAAMLNEKLLDAARISKFLQDELEVITQLPTALLRQAFSGSL